MMKLIVLALIVTVLSADFVPKWSSCSDPSDSWHPTNVTLNNAPTHGKPVTASICGESVDTWTCDAYSFKVKILNIVVDSGTTELKKPQILDAGQTACWNFTITVPPFVIGTVAAEFWPVDDGQNTRGCVEIDVTV